MCGAFSFQANVVNCCERDIHVQSVSTFSAGALGPLQEHKQEAPKDCDKSVRFSVCAEWPRNLLGQSNHL